MSQRQRYAELGIQFLIFYSIGMHFVEVEFSDTDRSLGFFLWNERTVAAVFTIEYFVRWYQSRQLLYPFRLMALVDLFAILPFYVGFFVDLRTLRLVRTLRVLRMFKLYRYNEALKHLVDAIRQIRHEFTIIGFAAFIICWCASVAIHECEREAQPQAFGKLSDALWYVLTTVTTVGYGDKVPVTTGGRIVGACTMISGLILFGTFVSLIGAAFIEEVRKTALRAQQRQLANLVHGPSPWDLLYREPFDPQKILDVISQRNGIADSNSEETKACHLLEIACRQLVERDCSAVPAIK